MHMNKKTIKRLLKEMWKFYVGYCKDTGEVPFKSFKNIFPVKRIEIYRKATLYTQHHNINWDGDTALFFRYLNEKI